MPHHARMRPRNLGDDVPLEPFDAAAFGEAVHLGRAYSRIDRASHQDHGARNRAVAHGLEQGNCGEHRHGRLADRHHMHIALEISYEFNDVVDVVVEVEGPCRPRHAARIAPLGDVDLMVRKHVAHRAAQKRRVMPRHRRHDQHLGVLAAARWREIPLEINEIAEGLGDNPARAHGDLAAVHGRGADIPGGLAVTPRACARTAQAQRQRPGRAACDTPDLAGCGTSSR